MRPLDDAFLDAYFAAAEDRVSKSVGGYQLENLGIHLFEKIDGDHFTILGMPMLPLLAFFRKQGSLR
jgi:septum formation protein